MHPARLRCSRAPATIMTCAPATPTALNN
jgi:hypothetical protein